MIKPVVLPTVPLPDNWCIVQLLLVEAPGNEYQTPGCIPYGGAKSCEADSLRGLKTDSGLGWAGMANSGKYSETIEMA
ncbi:MAG: hypothetical protein GVY19_12615 [Bacteroidetes bacterium]|nr:hypothetical protein [Bacteroidota bacterium]